MSSVPRAKAGWLSSIIELTRMRITIAVTLTTATGCLLATGSFSREMMFSVLGVFLLASGASALNQCQEAGIDARMERTKHRPLPAGLIDQPTAIFISVSLMLLGMAALASIGRHVGPVLLLGAFAVVWYNGVYTYLKRVTPFAVVPGALIGAIPPVIGYLASDGELTNPLILLVAVFFLIWQVPHFWLLLLLCGDQYGEAGLPSLARVFSRRQLARTTFMWLLATAVAGLVFPTFGRSEFLLVWKLAIVVASVWLVLTSLVVLTAAVSDDQRSAFRYVFVRLNIYALIVMVCISVNAMQTLNG